MRNIWRIFRDDLRFAKSNIVAVLVMLMVCLAPVMFAWFSIAGSWDPYGNTNQLKVAIANTDKGYQSDLMPVRVNVGDRIANQLHDNDEYDWTFVSKNEALEGVRSGAYYAAIIIPDDFSQKMMAVLSSDTEQATIEYYLNLKANPVAPVLAGEDEAELLDDIRMVFTEVVEAMTIDLASDLVAFFDSDEVKSFGSRLVVRLDAAAEALDAAAKQVRAFSRVVDSASTIAESTATALVGTDGVADASSGVIAGASSAISDAVDAANSAVSLIEQQVNATKTSTGLDSVTDDAASSLADDVSALASSVSRVANKSDDVAESLKKAAESLAGSTGSIAGNLGSARDALGTAANRLGASASKVRQFRDDISTAIAKGDLNAVMRLVGTNASTLAQWLEAPVNVEQHAVYPVENYGSSIAPFYTILSIWAGAIMLVAILKIGVSERRICRYEEECGRPLKKYELFFGRYGIFLLLNLLQATIVCLGNMLLLHIQCMHPLLFLLAGWASALVFSSIAYAFAVSFGKVGKAFCIILLVMHVAVLGAEYPIQMTGDFFQAVYLLLPFSYGMRAMQDAIAGPYGMEYLIDLVLLLVFLLPSLLIGLLVRLSGFFTRKLEPIGFM